MGFFHYFNFLLYKSQKDGGPQGYPGPPVPSSLHSAKLKLAKSGSNQLKVLIIIYGTIDLGANSLLGANKIAYHFEWSP